MTGLPRLPQLPRSLSILFHNLKAVLGGIFLCVFIEPWPITRGKRGTAPFGILKEIDTSQSFDLGFWVRTEPT